MKSPEPLSDDLQDLLEAERDIDAPSVEQRQRMYARIAPLILPIGVDAPPAELGTAAGAASSGAGAKLVIVSLISAAVGAGGGAAGHAYYAAKHPTVVATPAAVVEPLSPVVVASSEPVTVPSIESASPVASVVAAASANAPVSRTSTLRSERLLLETASAALMKGDHASAISALRQHAQRYPKGELAQEREVLLVQALKASGDDSAAERRAKDFKKKFPGSLQQDSVDKASKPK